MQLLCVAVVAITLCLIGMLSPTSRGALLTAAILLFAAAGLPGTRTQELGIAHGEFAQHAGAWLAWLLDCAVVERGHWIVWQMICVPHRSCLCTQAHHPRPFLSLRTTKQDRCPSLRVCTAGFVAAYVYRQMRGTHTTALTLSAATAVPGLVLVLFVGLNTVLWVHGASSAVPLSTLIALLALWLAIDTPLVAIVRSPRGVINWTVAGVQCPPMPSFVSFHRYRSSVRSFVWWAGSRARATHAQARRARAHRMRRTGARTRDYSRAEVPAAQLTSPFEP